MGFLPQHWIGTMTSRRHFLVTACFFSIRNCHAIFFLLPIFFWQVYLWCSPRTMWWGVFLWSMGQGEAVRNGRTSDLFGLEIFGRLCLLGKSTVNATDDVCWKTSCNTDMKRKSHSCCVDMLMFAPSPCGVDKMAVDAHYIYWLTSIYRQSYNICKYSRPAFQHGTCDSNICLWSTMNTSNMRPLHGLSLGHLGMGGTSPKRKKAAMKVEMTPN